jgi:ribosome-binding ATPase YchF (GTP1/OBG family)
MGSEEDRKHWPRGSLERTLKRDFPGCSSALEAFKKIISSKDQTATQDSEEVKALKLANKMIEEALKDFDIDRLNFHKREQLKKMPLTTAKEIELWRDAWLSVIEAGKF